MSDIELSRDTTAPAEELSTNALFELLRDYRRRTAMAYLLARPNPVSLDELAVAIASTGDEPSEQRLARLSIDLHHVHLPKLADAGVVRYDPRSEVVEPLEFPPGVEAIFDSVGNPDGRGNPDDSGNADGGPPADDD